MISLDSDHVHTRHREGVYVRVCVIMYAKVYMCSVNMYRKSLVTNAQNRKRTGGVPRKGSLPFCSLEGRDPHHELLLPSSQELVGATLTPEGWQEQVVPL